MPKSHPARLGRPLTAREVALVEHIAGGQSNKAVGLTLGLSPLTVKSRLAHIGRKLGTGSRAGIVGAAVRSGQVVLPEFPQVARLRVPEICACSQCVLDLMAGRGLAGAISGLVLPEQSPD